MKFSDIFGSFWVMTTPHESKLSHSQSTCRNVIDFRDSELQCSASLWFSSLQKSSLGGNLLSNCRKSYVERSIHLEKLVLNCFYKKCHSSIKRYTTVCSMFGEACFMRASFFLSQDKCHSGNLSFSVLSPAQIKNPAMD